MIRLTNKELKEAKMMLSYYNSLDLDVGSEEGTPERDFAKALGKLIEYYERTL